MNFLQSIAKFFATIGLAGFLIFAWAIGVRVHPQNIPAYLEPGPSGIFLRLDFPDDRYVVGALAHESKEEIELSWGRKRATFLRRQTEKVSVVPASEIQAGQYSDWIFQKAKLPLITRRYEDSLFALLEKKSGVNVKETVQTMQHLSSQMRENLKTVESLKFR